MEKHSDLDQKIRASAISDETDDADTGFCVRKFLVYPQNQKPYNKTKHKPKTALARSVKLKTSTKVAQSKHPMRMARVSCSKTVILSSTRASIDLMIATLQLVQRAKQEQAAFEANARRQIIRQWFFDVLAALAFCFCVASMVALYVTYRALTQGL